MRGKTGAGNASSVKGLTNSRKVAVASHSASPFRHALAPISSRGVQDARGDGAGRLPSVDAENGQHRRKHNERSNRRIGEAVREAREEGERSISTNGGDRRSRSRMHEGRARGEEEEVIVGSALPPTPTFGAKNWLAKSPRRSKRADKG